MLGQQAVLEGRYEPSYPVLDVEWIKEKSDRSYR